MRTPDDNGFFSQAWWDAVVAAWNRSGNAAAMGGAGVLCFELQEEPPRRAWIHWDERGQCRRLDDGEPFTPRFSASAPQWQRFLSGEIGAMHAVLSGQLRYTGALSRVLPYVRAFDTFASTAKNV